MPAWWRVNSRRGRHAKRCGLSFYDAEGERLSTLRLARMPEPKKAACKTLVTQRMKRSGMRWRHAGGQAILTLRGRIQSERFEHGWQLLAQTYRADLAAPDNVVPFPTVRAC